MSLIICTPVYMNQTELRPAHSFPTVNFTVQCSLGILWRLLDFFSFQKNLNFPLENCRGQTTVALSGEKAKERGKGGERFECFFFF